jgi:2-methylcitrate dehydratase PrpD
MAVTEALPRPVSGKEFILAIAIGSDIVIRMRTASGVAGKAGFMAETVGPFGVASAVATIFNP